MAPSSLLWIPFALPSSMLCLVTRQLLRDSDTTSRHNNIQRKKGAMSNSVFFLKVNETFSKFSGQLTPHHWQLTMWLQVDTCPPLNQSLAKGVRWVWLDYRLTGFTHWCLGWSQLPSPQSLGLCGGEERTFLNEIGNSLVRNKEANKFWVCYVHPTLPSSVLFLTFPIFILLSTLPQFKPFVSFSQVTKLAYYLGSPSPVSPWVYAKLSFLRCTMVNCSFSSEPAMTLK